MVRCPNCGEENPERFRLCGFCGTSLAATTPSHEVRKTVTVVFSDLQGSTALGERLDSESLREVLNVYFREMQAVLERHGGTVEKFIGDAIMAVFGLPRLHEDDALRAVRAAWQMRAALTVVNADLEARWGVRLTNRTGVNTGEVVSGEVTTGQRLVTGDVVNTAARLEQAAPANEVLLGETTWRLVRDAVEVEAVEPLTLKGKAETVPAYKLLGASGEEGIARRADTPMVGRRAELAALNAALAEATAAGRPRLVTVFAPAGVGKSRLLEEFVRGADGVPILRSRCLPYGEGITFWPLAEMIRQAAGITDEDPTEAARERIRAMFAADGRVAERLETAIGLTPGAFTVEETFWAARRLIETVAAGRPLIVIVNDLHWAEKTFLDLIAHLADTIEAPVVIVGSARPELLEDHPDWDGGDAAPERRVTLQPLSATESGQVITHLLGDAAIDDVTQERIIQAAGGNPLYVEQMLSMLIDDGAIESVAGRWCPTRDLSQISVPPSISALLAARLDRLGPDERATLERASVVGEVFYPTAVAALDESESSGRLGGLLASLARKQLITPTSSTFGDEGAYRFLHILIRDEAYQGILKRRRAELHERFAEWLEAEAGVRQGEQAEIIGYHLEQATTNRAELGLLDDHGRALAVRASHQLGYAGHRAFARGDMPAAGNLLRRAAMLLPIGTTGRAELLIQAGEALGDAGELVGADRVLALAEEDAAIVALPALEANAAIVRVSLHYATEGADEAEILADIRAALPVLEAADDQTGLHRAYRLETLVHFTAGRYGAAEVAARQTVAHGSRAGDRSLQTRFLGSLAICALYGPRPVPEAIAQTEALLAEAGDDRKAYSLILTALAHLRAMQGEFSAARDLYGNARAILEELGWRMLAALTSIDSGVVELLADDPVAAERELRRDYETLERMGERNYISTTAAFLADALSVQERDDEALEYTRISKEVAAADDVSSQSLWRLVRGRILARRGDLDDAEALVREGLAIIRTSDEPDSQGNALLDLAEVLRRAGRTLEAEAALREGLALYEIKGNLVSADRARAKLAEVAVGVAGD